MKADKLTCFSFSSTEVFSLIVLVTAAVYKKCPEIRGACYARKGWNYVCTVVSNCYSR